MKHQHVLALVTISSVTAFSQSTRFYSDPQATFKEAKEYFQKEQYSLAYPIFKELQQSVRETDKGKKPPKKKGVRFHKWFPTDPTVCGWAERIRTAAISQLQVLIRVGCQ